MRKKIEKILSLLICGMMITTGLLVQILTLQKSATTESDEVLNQIEEDHSILEPQARGTRAGENGTIFDGAIPKGYMHNWPWWCTGVKFNVNIDCTVDRLGVYRSIYPRQYYNLRLWTESGTLLCNVQNVSVSPYSWEWFSISPITLTRGTYIVSAGLNGYIGVADNPGPTNDGVIEPTNWVYKYGAYEFPSYTKNSTLLPLVDIRYYVGSPPPTQKPDIIVPDNYTTIQEAIDAANPGETIFVRESPTHYEEELIINKTIDLIGENRDTTIINASSVVTGSEYTVHITGGFVNLRGFTITGGDCGIFLDYSNNCTINGNTIKENNDYGIFMDNSDNDTVKFNRIFLNNADGDSIGYGILAQDSHAKGVWQNFIHDNKIGVKLINSWLWGCLNWNWIYDNDIGVDYDPEPLEIDGNMLFYNRIAIKISGDDSPVIITNNTIVGSEYGIYIETGSPHIKGNLFENNTYAIYYVNDSSPTILNNIFNNNMIDIYGIILAQVNIDPDSLNLKSKGRWITCYIGLPGDLDVNEIDILTIEISKINDNPVDIPVQSHPIGIDDYDGDGKIELMIKFDRSEIQDAVAIGENELTMAGQFLDGTEFGGSDTIMVINPP